jgi:hypothetical protein
MANMIQTDVCYFLKVVSKLNKLNTSTIEQLAKRFDIGPDALKLLIKIHNEGGGMHDN